MGLRMQKIPPIDLPAIAKKTARWDECLEETVRNWNGGGSAAGQFSSCQISVQSRSSPLSKRLPQPLLQLLPIAAAQRQSSTVVQDHDVLAVEPGLQLLDPIRVDDPRPMNANESARVQPRFHVVHRLAEEVRVFAQVQTHIVARRFNPIELVGPQEEHAAARLHHQPIELLRLGLQVLDERQQAAAEVAGATPLEMLAGVLQRLLKTI